MLHVQDTTFEMERQRNKPVKYNRELVHKSVKAMQKVEEVCYVCYEIVDPGIALHSKIRLQCLHRPSAACVRHTCKTTRQNAHESSFPEMLLA